MINNAGYLQERLPMENGAPASSIARSTESMAAPWSAARLHGALHGIHSRSTERGPVPRRAPRNPQPLHGVVTAAAVLEASS